jgi:hypothetical protein
MKIDDISEKNNQLNSSQIQVSKSYFSKEKKGNMVFNKIIEEEKK